MVNKTIFLVFCLCLMFFKPNKMNSQTYRSFSLVHSPGSIDNSGYSVGVQFEYEVEWIYISPEIYLFPNLNDYTYFHTMLRLGVKYEPYISNNFSLKYHAGPRLGFIFRETAPCVYVNLGLETGIQLTHSYTGWFIRGSVSNDWRTDSKLWGNDPTHSVASGWLTIGKRF